MSDSRLCHISVTGMPPQDMEITDEDLGVLSLFVSIIDNQSDGGIEQVTKALAEARPHIEALRAIATKYRDEYLESEPCDGVEESPAL